MDIINMEVENMAGLSFSCSCGKRHSVAIKEIKIGEGIINEIQNILSEFKGEKIFIVEDENTYKAAGSVVENLLKSDFNLSKLIFENKHLVADERALGRMLIEIPQDTKLILAVGSGTINDLCRYLSFKLRIPYVVVCTAPSMDGYASVVSPLVVEGVKTTYNAVYPQTIIADINVLKVAPMKMLHAGLGDILGKYTALADWQLSRVLNGEYYCSEIADVTFKALQKCIEYSKGIPERDPKSIKSITEALILSGLAIGMCGSSRPASGEEHHLSHCWETIFMNESKTPEYLHGNNVGVGVGIIVEAYKYVSKIDIEKIYSLGEYRQFTLNRWVKNLDKVYGKLTPNIAKDKVNFISFDEAYREEDFRNIMDKWINIKEICDQFLPSADAVRKVMIDTGTLYKPSDLGLDKDIFKNSFIAAKDIRKRYGILQLLEDIGMLEDAAEVITNKYYES